MLIYSGSHNSRLFSLNEQGSWALYWWPWGRWILGTSGQVHLQVEIESGERGDRNSGLRYSLMLPCFWNNYYCKMPTMFFIPLGTYGLQSPFIGISSVVLHNSREGLGLLLKDWKVRARQESQPLENAVGKTSPLTHHSASCLASRSNT